MAQTVIKSNYIVMAKEEWCPDMTPLIAAEFRGIAEQFAAYWTETNHKIFRRTCQAGVYDGQTGQLLTGYKDGQIIINNQRKAAPIKN